MDGDKMKMTRSIHPFPARMAPDLAIDEIRRLKGGQTVLDPMTGSGTVLREANRRGHRAWGFDVDPLAVLVSRVATTPIDDSHVEEAASRVVRLAGTTTVDKLPWIAADPETDLFVKYWFAVKQRRALAKIAWAIYWHERRDPRSRAAFDVLRVALSRIIITKDRGASLARDVSHSRPHKVAETSDYDVFEGFQESSALVRKLIQADSARPGTTISLGDARAVRLEPGSIDLVLTSPPYLNAIDYLRGHRLSLVWLGHSLRGLREIRANAIGAERKCDISPLPSNVALVQRALVDTTALDSRRSGMITRYALDLTQIMNQMSRALRLGGRAVLVVGNSCLRSTFIRNSAGVVAAARGSGLALTNEVVRDLPESSRYLPLARTADLALGKRMRTESVLTFEKSAVQEAQLAEGIRT